MTLLEWLPLAGACLAGAASPGPSLVVVLSATVSGGRIAGMLATWAHASGVGLYAALTVFGLAALVTQAPVLHRALQIGGALYLLWMARALLGSSGATQDPDAPSQAHHSSALRDGFAIAFLNPKLAVFMLALFSQFVSPDVPLPTALLLVATATLIDGMWYSVVTLMVSRPGWLDALRHHSRLVDRSFGVILAAIGLYILALSLR